MKLFQKLFMSALISAALQVGAEPLSIAEQGYFFVGGEYSKNAQGQQIRTNQMFVQYQKPAVQKYPYPVVMWHGGGQTGTNFLATPDGREGWATYFLRQGFSVYVVDQPARGRSGFFTDVYGKTRKPNAQAMSDRFTAPQLKAQYPQAQFHTQWPGSGVAGDPIYDQFFSSQVEDIEDVNVIEKLNLAAGVALIEKIGPSVLLTHSQSGSFGWLIANAKPELVKGIVAIEPNGPPLYEMNLEKEGEDFYKDGPIGRVWGITRLPLKFNPPAQEAQDLKLVRQAKPDAQNLVRCWVQPTPARELTQLKGKPILIVSSHASYHVPYDHCTSKFLSDAGVSNTYVRLPDVGIKGNGHMMMLEKNNLEIAQFLTNWITGHIQ
jgi:pimeloyl-ACP methyl ester carboxylesterase